MWQQVLRSITFHERLLELDKELARKAAAQGCGVCGKTLHSADYPRTARGTPAEAVPRIEIRYSFCCSGRDCRKRMTPPSVRFLDRRRFVSVLVVLAVVVTEGVTGARLRRLRQELDLDRRTLERWRTWWKNQVPRTDWWHRVRSLLSYPVEDGRLPGELIGRFKGDPEDQLLAFLRLLRPLSQSAAMRSRFSMAC